jgi:hypothetical protein
MLTMPTSTRPLQSDLELGRKERERRRCVIACRLPRELALEVEKRAARARISKSAFVRRLVLEALAPAEEATR